MWFANTSIPRGLGDEAMSVGAGSWAIVAAVTGLEQKNTAHIVATALVVMS